MELRLEVKKVNKKDWQTLKTVLCTKRNIASFKKQAKKISLKSNIQEVAIEARGDDDPIIQEWYKGGKMSFKMF